MSAPRTTEYAVRGLLALALEGENGKVRQAAELARASGAPAKFLEQVLGLLRKGGFVKSRRGAGGGYELAKSAEKIRMSEVIQWIEGEGGDTVNHAGDHLGEEWSVLRERAREAAQQVFDGETLAAMAERVRGRRAARGKATEYQI
ncbi:MAG: Rrf2 family transcriptional regulator [Verrucomicrobia bacterium]|nr:Rrf2 family transcriptional regulator [Verrucomicrobiota bacterium]